MTPDIVLKNTGVNELHSLLLEKFNANTPPDIFRDCYDYMEYRRDALDFPKGTGIEHVKRIDPLLRDVKPNEGIVWGTFDYEFHEGFDLLRVCYFDRITGRPIESFDDDLTGTVKLRQFYRHEQEEIFYPHRELGAVSLPLIKQTEFVFKNQESSGVSVRRMVFSGFKSDSGLETFFLVSTSNFAKEAGAGSDIAVYQEQVRTYFQPGEEYWDRSIVYKRNTRGKLVNNNPPSKFRKIAGRAETINLPVEIE